jgi:hypothetical protein
MAPINRVAPRAGHQQGSPLPDNVRRPSDLLQSELLEEDPTLSEDAQAAASIVRNQDVPNIVDE